MSRLKISRCCSSCLGNRCQKPLNHKGWHRYSGWLEWKVDARAKETRNGKR